MRVEETESYQVLEQLHDEELGEFCMTKPDFLYNMCWYMTIEVMVNVESKTYIN